jgi:hypothetical protein
MHKIIGSAFVSPRNMISPFQRALATSWFAGVLLIATACAHKPVSPSVPQSSTQPDQVNTPPWDQGWTNLVNDVQQSFTPSLPRLVGVEAELVVGNAGVAEDQLTLTLLDATGATVTVVTETVQTADCDNVMFVIPGGGVEVTPGQMYRLKLSGGTTFGWKYVVGGYENGEATFDGKPLLAQTRSTFLFRTFGAK